MSFFDDASLAFLPSGAAGKDGKAYSIKPVPEYGSELVTNGDFATDSDWIKQTGWTISGGKANSDGTINQSLSQANVFTIGKSYRISFSISDVAGSLVARIWMATGGAKIEATAEGNYITDWVADATSLYITTLSTNTATYSIDNVSVKEVSNDGDFTFSRGSNLSATRVGADGLIEKGRENLLVQSNNFDTTWNQDANVVLTSGQSGYDNTNNAWKFDKDASQFRAIRQTPTYSGVVTFSVYAKEGTLRYLNFYSQESLSQVWFDLQTGGFGSVLASIDANIEDVGGGWYRCSVTYNSSSGGQVRIYPSSSSSAYTAVAGNIYIQDAQLEIGLAATEVIESGASTGKAGLLEDEPRFDYSGDCPSLLLEPSRTNLVEYSEYKASGNFTNSTPSYNAAASPEGLQNATEMFDNSTNGQHRVPIGSFSVTSGTNYTISAFVKNNDIGYCYLLLEGDFTQTRYYFNLSTGQAITSGLEVENFENGWYRIYVTQSAAASGTGSAYLNMSNNGVSPIYVGSNQSLYFYGFQAEEGSYPTSYIPNHSGGTITRGADAMANLDIPDFNDNTSFSVLLELTRNGISSSEIGSMFSFYNDSLTQQFWFHIDAPNAQVRLRDATNSNATMATISFDIDDRKKIAFSCDGSTLKTYADGVLSNTYNLVNVFNVDELRTAAKSFDVHQIVIFPTALSDADCITLTTI